MLKSWNWNISLGETEQASTSIFKAKKQRNNEVNNSVSCKIKVSISIDSLRLEDNLDEVYFFLSLKERGSKIKSLTLKSMKLFLPYSYVVRYYIAEVTSIPIDRPGELYNLDNDFWFEYVLEHCPSLKSFTIIDPGNMKIRNSITPKKHDSIERLTLQYLSLSQKDFTLFPYISKLLPALKFLSVVIDCEHYWGEQQLKQEEENELRVIIQIHLPYTSLEVFTWGSESFSFSSQSEEELYNTTCSICYLKIKIFGRFEDFYYELNDDKITSLSKRSYYKKIANKKRDDERLFIEIYCSKISQFRLALKNSSDKTFDINL